MTSVNSYIDSGISNMTTFKDFLVGANSSGAGYLFTGITFLVYFILLISLAGFFGFESALLSAGFIGLILSLLFVYIGVMGYWVVGFFIAQIVLTILYIVWSSKYD